MMVAIGLAALGLGYAIGVLQGGIHIHTGQKVENVPAKVEYNKVIAPPPEVDEYLTKNQGHIR